MKRKISILVFIIFCQLSVGQVGINTVSPNAQLDIQSSDQTNPLNTDGILIPKIDEFPLVAPSANQDGMLVFVTGLGTPTKGFYYWDQSSTTWVTISGAKRINELVDGRSDLDGTDDGSSIFLGIGAGENDDLTNNENIGIGYQSMQSNIDGRGNVGLGYTTLTNNTGSFNVALGYLASTSNLAASFNTAVGNAAMWLNETGVANTAVGTNALQNNVAGGHNVAVGNQALFDNLAAQNVAVGSFSLSNNTTGIRNSAVGYASLYLNVTGSSNTAFGFEALRNNTGFNNTAIGSQAMRNNTSSNANTAVGVGAMEVNTTGGSNTAMGVQALSKNISGGGNVAVGWGTSFENTTGSNNIAMGGAALRNNILGSYNVAVGDRAGFNAVGFGNVFLGYNSGYDETGNNKLYIENTNANAANALIYGEFDNNFLRFNSSTEINGRTEITNGTDATGTVDTGALEIANTLRIDGNEIITNANTPLYLQQDNNGDLIVDGGTLVVDSDINRVRMNGALNLNEVVATGVALRVNGAEALWYNGTYFSWGFGALANYFADPVGIGITAPNVELDVNGDIEYTGTISGASDRRLKENFLPIDHALSQLLKVTGYSYNRIDDDSKKREYGVIAQELQEIFPEMVSTLDPDSGYLGVSYVQLTPVLIEAIKEQQGIIEKLQKELQINSAANDDMEVRVSKLEALLMGVKVAD